jgi:hypothetical protein
MLSGIALSLMSASTGLAATALFKDSILHITDGIVLSDGASSYYRDIQLVATPQGEFRVLEAKPRDLATVEEAAVTVSGDTPPRVEVQIKGYLPNPCVELEPVAVARDGDQFHVLVAQNVLQTLVACIQVIQPFELNVPLDTAKLPNGRYTITVNDKYSLQFDLP